MITADVAADLQAKIVVEGANGPTTSDGEQVLVDRGVTVIPDILANSGGVVGSFFEWYLNRAGDRWTLDQHDRTLERVLHGAYTNVASTAARYGTSLREAAFVLAVDRVRQARCNRSINLAA